MGADQNGERISVSREALRADLLDLELRLREALQLKADAAQVLSLQTEVARQAAVMIGLEASVKRIDEYGSSEMRDVKRRMQRVEQDLASDDEVREALREQIQEGRSGSGHKWMVLGVGAGVAAVAVNILFAVVQAAGG